MIKRQMFGIVAIRSLMLGSLLAVALLSAGFIGEALLHPAQAHFGSPAAMSMDMDTSGNTPSTLSTRQDCAAIDPGGTVIVDITVDAVPEWYPLIGTELQLIFDDSVLTIETHDPRLFLASNPHSAIFDVSEYTPDTEINGGWNGAVIDIGDGEPEFGSGVLVRLTVSAPPNTAPGLYKFDLANVYVLTFKNETEFPHLLNDGTVAVGIPCPAPTATPIASPAPPIIGFDGDGAPPAIDTLAYAHVGTTPRVTLATVLPIPNSGLGSWATEISYDPSVISLVICDGNVFTTTCETGLVEGIVRISGAGPIDVSSTDGGMLADITFLAVGTNGQCSDLRIQVLDFADASGNPLAPTVVNGRVCLYGAICSQPSNDAISNPITVGRLPYIAEVNTECATTSASDPSCYGRGATVWFSFTASNYQTLEVRFGELALDATLSVYSGTPANLQQLACEDFWPLSFDTNPGQTYFIMAGSFNGLPGGELRLEIDVSATPFTADIALDSAASLSRDGLVTVTGTVRCSRPSELRLGVLVSQDVPGPDNALGYTTGIVSCSGVTAWQLSIASDYSRFRKGPAEVAAELFSLAVASERVQIVRARQR